MAIDGYFICKYWWLFRCKPLVVILLVIIDGYFINSYYWLLYYKLLLVIICYITTIGDYCCKLHPTLVVVFVVMGRINFEDHALIKRWWACKKLNVRRERFKDEKNMVTVESNLHLLLEVVCIFKVLEFTSAWVQIVPLKNYRKSQRKRKLRGLSIDKSWRRK